MSELATQNMSERDATQLTEKIRITAHNYADARQKLQGYVAEAKAGNAHLALGYPSWTAYLADVLGEEPMRLARGERQEMVQMLSAEGMSTRAIAPIVGSSHQTVKRDIETSVTNVTDRPRIVESMDGITRTFQPQPEPATSPTPKRRPLTDQARDAGLDLMAAVERIQRITKDDRFASNKEAVAPHLRGHLTNAVEACQDLLDRFNH